MIYSLQNKIFIDLKYFVGRGASSFWSLDSSKPGKRLREFWWISSSSFQSWCLEKCNYQPVQQCLGHIFEWWVMVWRTYWIHSDCKKTLPRSQEKAEKALKRTTRPPAITLPKDETLEAPPSPKPLRRSSRLPAIKVQLLLVKVLRVYLYTLHNFQTNTTRCPMRTWTTVLTRRRRRRERPKESALEPSPERSGRSGARYIES